MHILHLNSAITSDASVSRQLTAQIVDKIKSAHPNAHAVYRDLNEGIPMIDNNWFAAIRVGTETPTAAQAEQIRTSDTLLREVQEADVLVIGLPIYNFTLPATLKTWLDQIARAGLSFRYTAEGPEGLLTGKRAIIAYASAGTPHGSELDHASGYLRHMLGFMGITDLTFIAADNLAVNRDEGLARAEAALENLRV